MRRLYIAILLVFAALGVYAADTGRPFVTPFIQNVFDARAFNAADARRILGIINGGGTNLLTTTNTVYITVDNIADLRNVPTVGPSAGTGGVDVQGYNIPGDGGGSKFNLYPGLSVTIDDFIYFEANDGGGVWKREITLPFTGFPVPWAGGMIPGTESDGIVNRAALEKVRDYLAANGGGAIIVPKGSWTVTNDVPVTWRDNVLLLGDSGANLVATDGAQFFEVKTNNNVGFFNIAFSEVPSQPAIVLKDSTNVVFSGCSFVDVGTGINLDDSGSGSTNVAFLFNTFSNVDAHYSSFPTFNDGNGYVRIDYETSLGGGGGGTQYWFDDGAGTVYLTNLFNTAQFLRNNSTATWKVASTIDDYGTTIGEFRARLDGNEIEVRAYGYDSGNANGMNLQADPGSTRFRLFVDGTSYTELRPSAGDETTPYDLDTLVAHTGGNLLEVRNQAALMASVTWTGGLALGPGADAGSIGFAFGQGADANGSLGFDGIAIGDGSRAKGVLRVAIGPGSLSGTDGSMNFAVPAVVRVDDALQPLDNTGFSANYLTAPLTVITSPVVDLTTTASWLDTLPGDFYPTEFGVFVNTASAVLVQPTVRFGVSGTPAFYIAAGITTGLTAPRARHRFTTLATPNGANGLNLTADVTVAATATVLTGRFYAIGFLVQAQP